MKKVFFCLAICCFFSSTLTAQDAIYIKSFWKGSYLHKENGVLQVTDVDLNTEHAQWKLLDAGDGHYLIQHLESNTYLNFAQNELSSDITDKEAVGNLWILEKLPDGDHVRIKSAQQPNHYIHIERGLSCGPMESHWHSAMWFLERPTSANSAMADELASTPLSNTSEYFDKNRALLAHNLLRQEVGVPPLVWDERLAGIAQNFANTLALKNRGEQFVLEHSQNRGLGENVAGGFVSGDRPEIGILNGWGTNEKVNFNPVTRKCYDSKICGHYTQIVWRKTRKVGCAVAINDNGKYILVCNYDPQGNFNGEAAF